MEGVFSALASAVDGAPAAALLAAAAWGVLSILLSPCHLAAIPLIVGFIGSGDPATPRRAAGTAAAFAVGILVTIAAIGAVTAAAGRMMGDVGPWGDRLVAVLFLVIGLHLLGVIPLPLPGAVGKPGSRRGPLAALLLGLTFGVALGPCTFAYMAPMLGVTFRVAATAPFYGAALLAMYGVGHCGVIVLAGTFTGTVQRYLDWNSKARGADLLRKICGVLVIAAGFYMI